jgi:opacity protein-like surface antigen
MKQVILSIALMLPFSTYAADHALIPLIGMTDWSDDSGHTARGASISFENDSQPMLGFKYLYMLDNGFAVGGNVYAYTKDVQTFVQADEAGVSHIHAVAEYYMNPTGSVSPFIGLGIGFSAISFDGGVLDEESTSGESYELNAGLRAAITDSIDMHFEYKYTDFDMDDDIDNLNTNINTDSHSLMLGVAIRI